MNLGKSLNCFKVYDIRGKIGEELNEEIAYRIGRATTQILDAKSVVVGFDAKLPMLADSLTRGICEAGSDVYQLGLAGTEEMYAAVSEFDADAGIEVTASHNPIDFNGMKIVKEKSQPLDDQEFAKIKTLAEKNIFLQSERIGRIVNKRGEARKHYIKKILEFVCLKNLKPLKIVINSGNGAAGPAVDSLKRKLEQEGLITNFVYVSHKPDSSFPNGIPNPLLEHNRSSTADAVISANADFGVAFDGDFDRCFLFDHLGNFVPGDYVVGLLAEVFLGKSKGEAIIHDPRIVWNTRDIVGNYGGRPIASKTGHAFVKYAMRSHGAIYGGEISAHHYFKEFFYCDSGMIPWLMIWELLSQKNLSLAD